MSLLQRFIQQLNSRGLRIEGPSPTEPDDTLHLWGPEAERTPKILKALKAFKPQLVELYGRQQARADPTEELRPGSLSEAPEPRGELLGHR